MTTTTTTTDNDQWPASATVVGAAIGVPLFVCGLQFFIQIHLVLATMTSHNKQIELSATLPPGRATFHFKGIHFFSAGIASFFMSIFVNHKLILSVEVYSMFARPYNPKQLEFANLGWLESIRAPPRSVSMGLRPKESILTCGASDILGAMANLNCIQIARYTPMDTEEREREKLKQNDDHDML